VDIYNGAVADLMSGGDAAAAQAQIEGARAQIAALCAQTGNSDINACLATYGLSLPAVPGIQQPAPAEQPAPVEGQPAPVDPAQPPAAETLPAEPAEIIENLPQGITQEQVAPVLDSAKDIEAVPAVPPVAGQPAPVPSVPPVAETPPSPPPVDDAAAQAAFEVPEEEAMRSAVQEQGQAVEIQALQPQQVPQNVTIINQTNVVNNVVNNNTTNNTTNNTQNNTTNNTVINQQNNTQNNTQVIQQAGYGDALTQVILQIGTQLIVNTPGQDTDRFYDPGADEVYYEELSNGRVRETVTRPDGSQIVTIRNRNGDILRRSRILPNGQEYVLAYFDDRYDDQLLEWRDPGLDLPPLRLNIPVQDYVLDSRNANDQQVEVFFRQPPVEQVARLYSIDEVKRSSRVRDSVRKLEVGGLTFDTGAATISRDQVGALSSVANGMLQLLASNPGETFLIEGHTDAVGSEISNLQLSDLRAATVARILTDFYGVPPENLATQGYGERYLKIRTQAAERENRRVTIRRITPLITVANN
jgi:outer membrane protein OmpA-like peptidoglycan-associated protein